MSVNRQTIYLIKILRLLTIDLFLDLSCEQQNNIWLLISRNFRSMKYFLVSYKLSQGPEMPLHCPVISSSFSSLPLHKNLPNRVSFFVVIVLFCFLLLLLFTPFPRAPGHFTEVVCSHLV